MNAMFSSFNRGADLSVKDSFQRSKIIAAALALAISNLACVPSTEVESAAAHFNTNVMPEVNRMVSLWNENMVFDYRACIEQTRSFWMLRYTAAHPISRPVYSLDTNFFESAMGVGTFVSAEMQKFLNENKTTILYLGTIAAEVVHSIQQGQEDHG